MTAIKETIKFILLFLVLSITSQAAVLEVSQPVQITHDDHYERGQSIVYDGANYWLFYGRSQTVTGNYQNGDPDIEDYQLYYKTAESVEALGDAVASPVAGAAGISFGSLNSVYHNSEVWVLGIRSDTLFGWYYDGLSWNQITVTDDIPLMAKNHTATIFQDTLFIAYPAASVGSQWHLVKSTDPKIPGSWSAPQIIESSVSSGYATLFSESGQLQIVLSSSNNLILKKYDPTGPSWITVDQTSVVRTHGIALLPVDGQFMLFHTAMPFNFSYKWLAARLSSSLNDLFNGQAPIMIDQSAYDTNSWTSMQPSVVTDHLGTKYLFYSSERNNADPLTEITGNIWYLKIDWQNDKSIGNDHYTYIYEAVAAASSDDQIEVSPGNYFNDIFLFDKTITLLGPQAGNDPAGILDRGGEACLIRDDGHDFEISSGADGSEINGFKFGDSDGNFCQRVYINGAINVDLSYNIIHSSGLQGVEVNGISDGARIDYNHIYNASEEAILNNGSHDVVIDHNYITGQADNWAILTTGRATISNNTIINCYQGIGIQYDGSSETDRVEVSGNSISYIKYPGIHASGQFAFIYNNNLEHCNYFGEDGNGDWNYAAIHVDELSDNSVVQANNINSGINGIQTWADDVSITNNTIYRMGVDYPEEKIVNSRLYKNTAILVGSNWGSSDFDPFNVLIYNNHIAASNYHALFHSQNVFQHVDASFNWWGDTLFAIIEEKFDDRIDYSPWFGYGDDNDFIESGFQGDFGALWVDDNSPGPQDSLYINEALDAASDNTIINVLPGDYYENIDLGQYYELETPGSATTGFNDRIMLMGAQANVDPEGNVSDRPGGESYIYGRVKINSDGSGCGLNGFKIDAIAVVPDRSAIFIQRGPQSQIGYNIILNSKLDGIENGWGLDDAPGAVISYNVIESPDQYGIHNYSEDDGSANGNSGLQIIGNYIYNSTKHGIYLPEIGRDHLVQGNYLENCGTQGAGNFPIKAYNRCRIDGNTVVNCRNGILGSYTGSGSGDRLVIENNIINNIFYPGIVIGDFDDATNRGAHSLVYNNTLSACNNTPHLGTDNWQYGSIMVFDSAVGTIIEANSISNGVKGITFWADSVQIIANTVSDMGLSYPDEEIHNSNLYLNCGIQFGSHYLSDSAYFDPNGAIIFNNNLENNYRPLFYPIATGIVDASGNWWGSNNPTLVAAAVDDSVDYSPWLSLGSDIEPGTPGHQGFFSVLWVDDDSPQADSRGHIQEAVDLVTGNTVYVADGTYSDPINIESHNNLTIAGLNPGSTIIRPDSALLWGVGDFADSTRMAGVRTVNAYNIILRRLVFDFDNIKGDNVAGILFWNSVGQITLSSFDNMNAAGNREYLVYLKAPGYYSTSRAHFEFDNNNCYRTGRSAITALGYVEVNIHDNLFDKVDDDFGFGIYLGAGANADIYDNELTNYDTWATNDQYTVSAIVVENTGTTGMPPFPQTVSITNNNIHNCQYGIIAGNMYEGQAGDVDINLSIKNNSITGNSTIGSYSSGGIILTDEGRDVGSSITALIDSNTIENNGDNGIYIYSNGNGDITAEITNNWIMHNIIGIVVKDYALPSSSSYDLTVYGNIMNNNLNAENDAIGGYWDDGESIGNCWSDYTGSGTYVVPGSGGAIDRYPNDDCGACLPGDANDDEIFNILDISYLINYLYLSGPDPTPFEICSGDPSSDCTVNILDVSYLIAHLYQDGPPPASAIEWYSTCGS